MVTSHTMNTNKAALSDNVLLENLFLAETLCSEGVLRASIDSGDVLPLCSRDSHDLRIGGRCRPCHSREVIGFSLPKRECHYCVLIG
jgi:hypothetical protein